MPSSESTMVKHKCRHHRGHRLPSNHVITFIVFLILCSFSQKYDCIQQQLDENTLSSNVLSKSLLNTGQLSIGMLSPELLTTKCLRIAVFGGSITRGCS